MEEEKFKMRCYSKSELATLYFPVLQAPSAVRKLMRWIRRCIGLMEKLLAVGYQAENRTFSSAEVRLIVGYLGEP
jgi:hypothetical protein